MKKFLFMSFLGVLSLFVSKKTFSLEKNLLLTQSEAAFDPFIDYGDFQDNVTEEENIIFFQSGRSLNISLLGGYEAITFNIAQIYGDTPFMAGMAVSFFFDLQFAFQISGFFPYEHYNSLFNSTAQFMHFGIDLKYYLNKQYTKKEKDFFNPYVSFGPFWLSIKNPPPSLPPAQSIPVLNRPTAPNTQGGAQTSPPSPNSLLEKQAIKPLNGFGAKFAVGFEIPLVKQTFIGFEFSYLYANLEFEAEDLSSLKLPPLRQSPNQNFFMRRQFPSRPQVSGYYFYGDMANLVILLGVNF